MTKRRYPALLVGLLAWLIPALPAVAVTGSLALSADRLGFDLQRVGTSSASQRFTVTAAGGPVTVSEVVLTDTTGNDDFVIEDTDCERTLADGEDCFVDVFFAPTDRSARSAVIEFESDATNDPHVDAFGTGTVGYYFVGSQGELAGFDDARDFGDMTGKKLHAPVVDMATTPDGEGYWFVAFDGGIFAFGNAGMHGSMGGMRLNAPVVGMASTPSGNG